MAQDIRVVHSSRVHPASSAKEPTTTRLSLLDCTVVGFAPCSAIWLYDRSETFDRLSQDDFVSLLQRSLSQTLNSYPQWAGQLSWDVSEPAAAGRRTSRPAGDPRVGRRPPLKVT